MPDISICSSERVIPMIYAYSTPEIARHDGHLKIGYTDKQTVEDRIGQQGHEVDVIKKLEWKGSAVYDDGSGETFNDHDFRSYLYKIGYERIDSTEYVKISVPDSKSRFFEYRSNRGITEDDEFSVTPYRLRAEQETAVRDTYGYIRSHDGGSYLWNAKPRFGKTLCVYDLILRLGAKKVLIVTNRPAIADSWYRDYEKFIGRQSGYFFVSSVDVLRGRSLVVSHDDFEKTLKKSPRERDPDAVSMGLIEFVSLQDLKGSISFGGEYYKLEYIARTDWDLLVIDEAHEGVDTYRTDAAFDHIRRRFTLHLSGTPFKALANETFPSEAIFNWTYADEQAAKRDWNGEESNPYEALPKLNMFTYRMSEIVKDELAQGIEIDGEQREYAFDLNEFFATNGNGRFLHDSAVDCFLDALTTQAKFPFSTPELRNEIRHSLWLLNRVDSAKALAKKLKDHPVFKNYEIILAAGDGRMDGDDQAENAKSLKKVQDAIKTCAYTITLSVGQLTTGVTVPEWTAVLMLSSIKSPALYMQAAFRAQNPCMFRRGTEIFQKENAYVFDFDPARTLIVYDKFANDLMPHTAGDTEERRKNIGKLLNFFPVLGEDDSGEMVALDAEKVLSIPRKLKSQEVVKSGFMSNYLFTDAIGVVFHAPQEVIDIITSFTPADEPKNRANVTEKTALELSVDENGEVKVPKDDIFEKQKELFGEKIYDSRPDLEAFVPPSGTDMGKDVREKLRADITDSAIEHYVKPAVERVRESYGDSFRKSDQRRVEGKLANTVESIVNRHEMDYHIEQHNLKQEFEKKLEHVSGPAEEAEVRRDYEEKSAENRASFMDHLGHALEKIESETQEESIRQAETGRKEAAKQEQESRLRDHLRGFSRTIPSFLMAYGTRDLRLDNFDTVIPDHVFREVTGISLEQFRMLRDGGEYEGDDGQVHRYAGLFDETVFNDSVKEFLRKKSELADYFDESHDEDIFDYIPPQKTNQIFTPRRVVKQMVDALETENPGCFDDPDATFADLYMKSGLYITEIVKRLYHSDGVKSAYPDDGERIRHILRNQVYGLAPTEIIYRIATNYILGFDENLKSETKNFAMADTAEAAKNGTLEQLINEKFG